MTHESEAVGGRSLARYLWRSGSLFLLLSCWLLPAHGAGTLALQRIEPTPLFPTPEPNQPLRQRVLLYLDNPGPALAVTARITLGSDVASQDLGVVPTGNSTNAVLVPDITAPARLTIELLPPRPGTVSWHIRTSPGNRRRSGRSTASRILITILVSAITRIGCAQRSGTPTSSAHSSSAAETDSWDDDSKFRYVIETSEPITSFLGSHSEADAAELARRIREGRIQIGAIHNTANTEQMSQELMARLFYLTGRHTTDLLGVAPSATAQIDDVIGLTWPLATYCAAARVPYFFHGHNGCRAVPPARLGRAGLLLAGA